MKIKPGSQPFIPYTLSDIRSEVALVLSCSRKNLTPLRHDQIQTLVQQKLDWDYVVQLAVWHRVAALMFRSLNAVGPQAIPEAVQRTLRAHAQTVAANNLKLTAELLNLLSLFRTHHVEVAPFKGPVTAALIYGDLSLREFSDLDLLVPQQQALPAKELLEARGYRVHRLQRIARGQEAAFFQFETVYTLVHANTGITVDLHWELTRKYVAIPISLEKLWPRLRPVAMAGQEVLSLTPEDLLIFLCIHGAKHLWGGLDWICDIAELADAHPNLDWKQVRAQAESLGCERVLGLGLYLAHQLFGLSPPEAVQRQALSDRALEPLAAKIYANVFGKMEFPQSAREKFFFLLRARERFSDKIRYLWRYATIPSGSDLNFFQLPKSLMQLYWLLKPLRLMLQLIWRPQAMPAELNRIGQT